MLKLCYLTLNSSFYLLLGSGLHVAEALSKAMLFAWEHGFQLTIALGYAVPLPSAFG